MSAERIILEARDLEVVRGGVQVLDVPHVVVHEGEVLSLIGPNGAGKTTLLQALCYLLRPRRGALAFRGQLVNAELSVLQYRRKVAMVFQEPLLFDTTVFDNVAAGLRMRGVARGRIAEIVAEQLDRFGISQLSGRSARKLSGGEAQRTSLARAFAVGPEILFLDEPFAALDPPTREGLIEDLSAVLRKTETVAVFATHERLEAMRLADRVAILDAGRIVQIGSPADVMNSPTNEFVASFVGVETILPARVVEQNGGSFIATVSDARVEAVGAASPGEAVLLCIRPENVVLSLRPADQASARNVFPGRVIRVLPMGAFYKVVVDCGFPVVSYVTARSVEGLSLREGTAVTASFKATAVHVIRRD